jgi:hypothetical protein
MIDAIPGWRGHSSVNGRGSMASAVNWFEIPATDIERASKFYSTILGIQLDVVQMPTFRTAMFPVDMQKGEIGGAISQGEDLTPSATGTLVYLNAQPDLQAVLDRVEAAGGKVVRPKTKVQMEDGGYYAVIADSEGNKVGLHSMG